MLKGIKVLTIVSKDFDDLELFYPMIRLREAGAEVVIAAEHKNETYIGKYGIPVVSDISFDEVKEEEFSGILIPGGWAPDYLRRFERVLDIVRHMRKQGKVIAHICHAGWVLASADVIKGVNVTSTPGIKDDLINAGAVWHDVEAIIDQNIISSRRPGDLPKYLPLIIDALKNLSK